MPEEIKSVPVVQPDSSYKEVEPVIVNTPEPVIENISEVVVEKIEAEPATPEPKKFFENDDWKTEFGDDTPETLKSYKTKAAEYEAKVNELTKAEKVEFANEKIKHLNELAKNGIDIDENTVAFLNKDYNKIDNPLTGLAEAMKNEHPDWTDRKIDFELRQKYRLDMLKVEEGEEMTEAQQEISDIANEDITRDWAEKKKTLIEKQDNIRIIKPKSQEEINAQNEQKALQTKQQEEAAKAWDERVKKMSESNTKIKVEFPKETQKLMNDAKEAIAPFEFEFTPEEKQEAANLFHNPENFWKKFADKDGNLNTDESLNKIYNAMALIVAGPRAMLKLAETQYKAGREFEIKNDKKINFEPNKSQQRGVGEGKVPVVQPH